MTPEEIQQAIDRLRNLKNTSSNYEAKTYAYELLEQEAIKEDSESLVKIYNIIGIVYQNLSDYPKAFEYFEKALLINKAKGNNEDAVKNIVNIGTNYYCISDYPNSLLYFEKALYIYEEIDNKDGIAITLSNIGNVFSQISEFAKALEYYKKSLQISENCQKIEGISANLGNIGAVYNSLMDYPKALEYFAQALQIDEEIGNKERFSLNLGNMGVAYTLLLDYPKALEYTQKALQINEEIGNKEGIARNLSNIGNVYIQINDFNNSIEYIKKSISLSLEIGNKQLQITSLKDYSIVYEKMGDIEKAFSYYKQYIELKDEIQSEESKNKAQQFDQQRKLEEDQKARQLKLARFQEQERIFHNILPIPIANRLIEGEQTIADSYDKVSVFFSDFVGFTSLSSSIAPAELVQGLNKVFSAFDRVGTKYGLEKIKTIGDAYMAVCGLPEQFEDHQYRTAQFAVEILTVVNNLDLGENFLGLQIRIGLHCGSVVAGIIGEKKFAYDVWGDAVNIASRMESHSEAGRIHISEEFAKAIESYPEFSIVPRGEINIKGKGTMNTYWLEKSI